MLKTAVEAAMPLVSMALSVSVTIEIRNDLQSWTELEGPSSTPGNQ